MRDLRCLRVMKMIKRTESECLFESFCQFHGIRCEIIPTESVEGNPTPDYHIFVRDQKVVVEIKQIDPNAEEIAEEKKFKAGGIATFGGTPGARVRQKITAGSRQIRIRAKDKYPSILIVYNNVPLCDHTGAYHVLTAMYGLETHDLAVPKELDKSPYLLDKRFGPERRMTANQNTSMSAVGILRRQEDGTPFLCIYHNIYAQIPLDAELFRSITTRQFTLEEKQRGDLQEWREF